MPKLFGCLCNQPERLIRTLEPVQEVLRAPKDSISRWGLAYVQASEVLLSRSPIRVAGEFEFYPRLGQLRSDYVVGYAADEDDLAGNVNTQPFRYRRWFFAQEKTSATTGDVRRVFFDLLTPRFASLIRGRSSSEVVFFALMQAVDRAQLLDGDIAEEPGVLDRVLRERIRAMGKALHDHSMAPLGSFLLSNSRSMLAARLSGPLFMRRFRHREDPKLPDTEFKAVLVVNGDPSPREGFEEIPNNCLLHIGRQVTTNITSLAE